jgi:hypothetical protein
VAYRIVLLTDSELKSAGPLLLLLLDTRGKAANTDRKAQLLKPLSPPGRVRWSVECSETFGVRSDCLQVSPLGPDCVIYDVPQTKSLAKRWRHRRSC